VHENVTLEKRLHRARYFKQEYPDSVPVFVQYDNNKQIHRYLVPRNNTFGHLLIAFRKKHSLTSAVGLISLVEVSIDNQVKCYQVSSTHKIGDLADEYLHDDGFLYINITTENIFG
jgi:hypothetical protein